MSQSKAAPLKLTAAERRQRAVELRKLGFSYAKIAEQLGVSQTAAYNMVMKALKEINEKTAEGAEELRRLELERLDEWLLKIAQEIQAGRVLGAIDRGVRVMNRRAKLLGLDAPTKLEIHEANSLLLEEIGKAARGGNAGAAEALDRIIDGKESILAVWLSWAKPSQLIPACSPEETAKMTTAELEKAAQGKLTPEEFVEIRRRPVNEKPRAGLKASNSG